MAQSNSIYVSVGILGILGGSLLLLVNSYASSLEEPFIPHSALGILLLIIAALVAYTGVRHSLSHSQLFSTLCLTISALWCGSGLVYILIGQSVLPLSELKSSLIPGLAAFTLALFIIGTAAVFMNNPVLLVIAVSISLACAHQIAGLSDSGFGQSATAANYLLVCLVLNRIKTLTLRALDKERHTPHLGYSKYADAEVLGHACNVLAAFAITATIGDRNPLEVLVLPWAVMAGGVLQLLCGSVAFARGKTFESTAFILYGVMWTVWGLTRFGGLYGETRSFNVAVGIISFMLFNLLVTIAALFLNVAWFIYAFTFQLILISFLLDAIGALPYGYDIGVTIIFGLVSFYCFLAHLFNSTFQSPQIPLGKPLVKLGGVGGGEGVCPHVPARKASSVQQIAEIMKNGGICGMPTDTVYVLVAACNRPDAVIKAYKVKKQAQDRPMSMWISSVKQLEPVRHLLSPLLLDFMEAAWPSSISMVIPRGPWLDVFGLGDAAIHIGTPQSIAIRSPDCAVATHLINLVGPIAVTSANPTGEADTTHHNQVYAKLGKKVEGVLCDGPSPENIASTVVDCTKIETGHIGFFRVGLIPKSKVLQIFEEVRNRHRQGYINPGFEHDLPLQDMERDQSSRDTTVLERGTANPTLVTFSPPQSWKVRNYS
ncbi:PREDICTED: uncharacterized protein LOC107089027 [Cyprinodon variegatus]|uniref:uncharacterized protein LOC107089027 n=1 Tax=Cyprinodon variegatus TaxID=28743 RepID=UPI000742A439|nr:PREDICTED: uncharacterized protein LOC107089027 [Cyprinodon variegatus]